MAHSAANGFIAPFPDDCDFTVKEHKRPIQKKTYKPTGVFVHGKTSPRVYLNYAGVESSWSFELPSDPYLLREVAQALELMASDIEDRLDE